MRTSLKALAASTAALAVGLSACGKPGGSPVPPPEGPDPAPAVTRLAEGLSKADLTDVPSTVDPAPHLQEIYRGMDGLRPTVTVAGTRRTGQNVTADLTYTWPVGGAQPWTYTTQAGLTWQNHAWTLAFKPDVVHPQLGWDTRLVHSWTQVDRGRITGTGGTPFTETQMLARVGIDKSRVPADQAEAAARRLAQAFKVDADRYAAAVRGGGPQQFVEALTVRANFPEPAGWRAIPGAVAVGLRRSVAVDRELAPEIIGTVGEATPQQVAESKGTLFAGDQAGQSGLQKRYDEQLRGRSSTKITIAPRTTTATPGASPTPAATPTPGRTIVFDSPGEQGPDVATSLDSALQKKAEAAINGVPGSAAIAVVRPSSGQLVAAATSPGSNGNPDATFGRYAPGSTFKVVTALALLRAGLTPDSPVPCTENVTVDGRTFKNYSDFPASKVGTISLTEAIAQSCNTALISQHERITPAQLREAAASLGFGDDYDAGFSSFFGSVDDPKNVVGKAETMIGQGTAQASPMAMAAVAASVAAGRTVVPRMVDGKNPPPVANPLTADEAKALQQMMGAVVDRGTGGVLKGVATGAKSGTAEYGTGTPLKTHAWMIATTDSDLAIAVWVGDGESGSKSAAPVIRAFLS
ncbi:penicillin-binding transpeptidase domain-containing protein [Mariniluteicoccus endophyticus]